MVKFKKCKICGTILKESSNLSGYYTRHFKQHKIFDNFNKYLEDYTKRCIVCGEPVNGIDKIYCSNKCKFEDMKDKKPKREKNNETKRIKCKLCG